MDQDSNLSTGNGDGGYRTPPRLLRSKAIRPDVADMQITPPRAPRKAQRDESTCNCICHERRNQEWRDRILRDYQAKMYAALIEQIYYRCFTTEDDSGESDDDRGTDSR